MRKKSALYGRRVTRPSKPAASGNATDDLIRAVAKRNGIIAIFNIWYMLAPKQDWSFDAFARHIEHAVKVAGADHVAVGTDRTVFPGWKPHACAWSNWPYYTVGLLCRGFSEDEARRLIGANYLRYARRVLDKRPWGPFPMEMDGEAADPSSRG